MSKKWLRSMATAALVVTAGSAGAETLHVVTDPSFVPFEMLDQQTGKMIGFDMDMLKEVAERVGFDYELRTMDFNGIIPSLQTGNVDMAIAGITITDERQKIIDFSTPYYDSGLRILVPMDNEQIHQIADLEGLKIGTKIGSTSYDYLISNLDNSGGVTAYPGSSAMYMALLTNSVDAVLYDAPNVGYFAQTQGNGRLKAVGPVYQSQRYGIAFVKGSEWVGQVNQALDSIRNDGTYKTIYEKWFGSLPDDQ